jgi:hypothetical protein
MIQAMGMGLSATDLLPDEVVVASKNANAVVRLSEVGLKRLPFDHGMRMIGFAGKEAIGGKLHLTSVRLLFASHSFNRVTGRLSIFLPSIVATRNASRGLSKKLEVQTALQTFEFVVWGVPDLIEAIDRQRQALGPGDAARRLLDQVGHIPSSVGDAFAVSTVVDLIVRKAADLPGLAGDLMSDPLSLSTLIGLFELGDMVESD